MMPWFYGHFSSGFISLAQYLRFEAGGSTEGMSSKILVDFAHVLETFVQIGINKSWMYGAILDCFAISQSISIYF